jgi:DNA-binding LytR/AlgR family response regulator
VRIERSLLLNLGRVAFAERAGHGRFTFTMQNGSRLTSGASYRRAIVHEMRQGRLASLV